MYIYAIHLRNFRRFSKLTVYPNPKLNILLGSNNSGKTSILCALDLVLNPSYHPYLDDLIGRFDFYQVDITKRIEIWVFLRMEDTDSGAFGDKISRWSMSGTNKLHEVITNPNIPDNVPFESAIKKPMEEEVLDSTNGGIIELLAVCFSAYWIEEKGGFELSWKIVDEVGDETPFTQTDRRAIGFTLIPTHRDPAQMLGFTRRSLFAKEIDNSEISKYLRDIIQKVDTLKTSLKQTTSMKKALEAIKETAKELQLFGSNEEIDATITFLKAEIGKLRGVIELAFSPAFKEEKEEADFIVDNKISFNTMEALPLSSYGDGMQNALLISRLSTKSTEKGQSIEAIEEPEQSLEPWRVRSLVTKIQSNSSSQLFITTHSPAAVGEINGVENLLLLVPTDTAMDQKTSKNEIKVIHGRELPDPIKKEFEGARDIYTRCLFGRLILIVEGQSETGYLPVALRFAAKKRKGPDLCSLGLEFFENFENRQKMDVRAERLKLFGKQVAVLLDHDENKPGQETTIDRLKKSAAVAATTFVWSGDSILTGAQGCDLEIILAEGLPILELTNAIKKIYSDPGHEIEESRWKSEYSRGLDTSIDLFKKIPKEFPDPRADSFLAIEEEIKRLILFALMHTPHSCKSGRDMRRLAEILADNVPEVVLCLYDKLRDLLENKAKNAKPGYWDLHKGKFVDPN